MGNERWLPTDWRTHRQNALGSKFVAASSAAGLFQHLLGACLHETPWGQLLTALAALDWILWEPVRWRSWLGQSLVELRVYYDWLTNGREACLTGLISCSVRGLGVLLVVVLPLDALISDQRHDFVDADCLLHGGRRWWQMNRGLAEVDV